MVSIASSQWISGQRSCQILIKMHRDYWKGLYILRLGSRKSSKRPSTLRLRSEEWNMGNVLQSWFPIESRRDANSPSLRVCTLQESKTLWTFYFSNSEPSPVFIPRSLTCLISFLGFDSKDTFLNL